jgi:hypothetical protein
MKATTRKPACEPQKRADVRPASMAPGMATMEGLSISSMTAMETLSAAMAKGGLAQ